MYLVEKWWVGLDAACGLDALGWSRARWGIAVIATTAPEPDVGQSPGAQGADTAACCLMATARPCCLSALSAFRSACAGSALPLTHHLTEASDTKAPPQSRLL